MSRLPYLSLLLALSAACSDVDDERRSQLPVGTTDAGTKDASALSVEDARVSTSLGDAAVSIAGDGCSDQARWIYLLDRNNAFLRFEPDSGKITEIGKLSCSGSASPFSMAVSRNAIAYVLYDDGNLYEVSTSDASCKPTKYKSSDPNFKTFGMGFASDAAGGAQETLYIVAFTGSFFSAGATSTLASLDTNTWAITPRGSLKGAAELTGNGKAELWGYFVASPMTVRQLDKSSGATIREIDVSSIDPILSLPSGWAFAFWGGSYYMFYQSSFGSSTSIYRVDPTSQKVEPVKMDIGYGIVGAGVSTCAPVVLL